MLKKGMRLISEIVVIKTLISFWHDKAYRSLIYIVISVLVLGTVVYHYVEHWRWIDAFYFSVVTLTTVGFGDFAPQTDIGKLFTVLYIVVGIGIILSFIEAVYTHFNQHTFKGKKLK